MIFYALILSVERSLTNLNNLNNLQILKRHNKRYKKIVLIPIKIKAKWNIVSLSIQRKNYLNIVNQSLNIKLYKMIWLYLDTYIRFLLSLISIRLHLYHRITNRPLPMYSQSQSLYKIDCPLNWVCISSMMLN